MNTTDKANTLRIGDRFTVPNRGGLDAFTGTATCDAYLAANGRFWLVKGETAMRGRRLLSFELDETVTIYERAAS